MGNGARSLWVEQHNQFEADIALELKPVRGLASKAAEHLGRIAGVLTLIADPNATVISEDAMQRAAILTEFYLSEALRLAGVQPLHARSEQAAVLWSWLRMRGKTRITLVEMTQFAPNRLRKAEALRSLMDLLADHYMVRPVQVGMVEFDGKVRREAWEVRL